MDLHPVIGDDTRYSLLRPLGARPRQFRCLHSLRLQLLQAADEAGLANVWSVFGVPRRPLRGDVRLSVDDLSAVRLVAAPLSRGGYLLSRGGPPLVLLFGP